MISLDAAARTLGVRTDAPKHVVKRQYRRLARATHPDRHPGIDTARFRRIQEAFELFEYAWANPSQAEPPSPPPPPSSMGVCEWLTAVGMDVDGFARSMRLSIPRPAGGRAQIVNICEAFVRKLSIGWPTMPRSFERWVERNIQARAIEAWDRSFDDALRYLDVDVYRILIEHIVTQTPEVVLDGPVVHFRTPRIPAPTYSDEAARIGLWSVIFNRTSAMVEERTRRARLEVLDGLADSFADSIKLISLWSSNQSARFEPRDAARYHP